MNFDFNFAAQNLLMALSGIPTTLVITFVAALIGIPLAFFIALARMNKVPVLDNLFTLYISFLRGTPTIVQIYLVYSGMPIILKAVAAALNIEFDVYSVNPIIYAFIVYGLNSSAVYSEMWKSGLSAVGKGQLEAAQTSGLTNFQAYIHIIIPQAVGVCAPSFCSSTLNMLKNTSLVFLMTVQDITAKAKIAAGQQYKYVEGYVDILITYIIVCSILELLFKIWEKSVTSYKTLSQKTAKREGGTAA